MVEPGAGGSSSPPPPPSAPGQRQLGDAKSHSRTGQTGNGYSRTGQTGNGNNGQPRHPACLNGPFYAVAEAPEEANGKLPII